MGSEVSIIVFGFMTSPSPGFCGCCLGPGSWENGLSSSLQGRAANQKLNQHPDSEATGHSKVPELSLSSRFPGMHGPRDVDMVTQIY